MLARAIALASVLGDDGAQGPVPGGSDGPLDLLPAPWADLARAARARLASATGGARAALLARETVALFAPPRPALARRVAPRGLARALAPEEPAAPAGPLPEWLGAALAHVEALGLRALARASTDDAPGPTAELLRHLTAEQAAVFVATRRAGAPPAELHRCRTVVGLARRDPRRPSLPRWVGLLRLAWAATVEPGALQSLAATVPSPEREQLVEAGDALWFAGSEHAAAERAAALADLERGP